MTSKRIQRVWEEFQDNTASHQLGVAHVSVLYRHLRVGVPATRLWGWEIATWPGALAIHGDVVQPEIFTGASDMLADFFDVAQTDDVAIVLRETEPPVAESLSGEDAREFTDSFLRACFAIHKTRQMGGQDR